MVKLMSLFVIIDDSGLHFLHTLGNVTVFIISDLAVYHISLKNLFSTVKDYIRNN